MGYSLGATPWLFHCYSSSCQTISVDTIPVLPATPTQLNIPPCRCTNMWISQACSCVEQLSLCWIIHAQLVNLRVDTKDSSHPTMMLISLSSSVFFFFCGAVIRIAKDFMWQFQHLGHLRVDMYCLLSPESVHIIMVFCMSSNLGLCHGHCKYCIARPLAPVEIIWRTLMGFFFNLVRARLQALSWSLYG